MLEAELRQSKHFGELRITDFGLVFGIADLDLFHHPGVYAWVMRADHKTRPVNGAFHALAQAFESVHDVKPTEVET